MRLMLGGLLAFEQLPVLLFLWAYVVDASLASSSAAPSGGVHDASSASSLSLSSPPISYPSAAAFIHPKIGIDSVDFSCSETSPCRTVAFAVSRNFNTILLAPLAYNEATIVLSSVSQISMSGVGGAAVIDCGLRIQPSPSAPAFHISSSNVTFSNMTFQNCGNARDFGGAISASLSSLYIDNCTFISNRAMSGGAVALSSGLLSVAGSVFTNNSATCDLSTCSSAWGGAIVLFNADSVIVATSTFVSNSVFLSPNASLSRVPVATFAVGGGCIAVNYNTSSNSSTISIFGNTLINCVAQILNAPEASGYFSGAYGGAVSVFYGLNPSAASSVSVTGATFDFLNNKCSFCSASIKNSDVNAPLTAAAYGGCLSVFIGSVGSNSGDLLVTRSLFLATTKNKKKY
jgi:hypothetical protein